MNFTALFLGRRVFFGILLFWWVFFFLKKSVVFQNLFLRKFLHLNTNGKFLPYSHSFINKLRHYRIWYSCVYYYIPSWKKHTSPPTPETFSAYIWPQFPQPVQLILNFVSILNQWNTKWNKSPRILLVFSLLANVDQCQITSYTAVYVTETIRPWIFLHIPHFLHPWCQRTDPCYKTWFLDICELIPDQIFFQNLLLSMIFPLQ